MRTQDEERIYQALSQVETPPYDIAGAVARARTASAPRPRRRAPRLALAAAALVLALCAGAAAVAGLSFAWRYFVDGPIPQNAVTTLGVSQTAGDYTLTLEDAMADDNGLVLLLALRRADGGAIDPGAHLQGHTTYPKLLADGASFGGGGGFDGSLLSEDGATRYFYYELRNNQLADGETLSGKEFTFTADGVALPLYSDNAFGYVPPETVDLSPLSAQDIPDFSHLEFRSHAEDHAPLIAAIEAQNAALPLPLDEAFPQYTVRGAVTLEDGLAIAVTQGRSAYESYACRDVLPEALIDTRDGARYTMYQGKGLELSDGAPAMLYTFRDCPLTAGDLPYLRLEFSYFLDRILSTQPFSLTFTADSGASLLAPLEREVTVTDTPLHLTELRLSALGMSLHFSDGMDTVFDAVYPTKTAPVLLMKDGSTVSTVWQGGSGGGEACRVAFQSVDADGERLFLDTAQVQSVELAGQTLWTAPE